MPIAGGTGRVISAREYLGRDLVSLSKSKVVCEDSLRVRDMPVQAHFLAGSSFLP